MVTMVNFEKQNGVIPKSKLALQRPGGSCTILNHVNWTSFVKTLDLCTKIIRQINQCIGFPCKILVCSIQPNINIGGGVRGNWIQFNQHSSILVYINKFQSFK